MKFQIGDNFPIPGGFVEVLGTTPVNDGIFHHVAGVRDRTTNTVKFYVDGVLEATAPDTTTGPIDGGTTPLTIGTLFFMILGPQPEFFEGLIDEVEIYNRALSAAEIQAIFAAGSAGKCTPEVGAPVAIAGTSLNGNNMLQLDGTLSSDPQGDPLTFSWQIEGEATPRTGRIVSIADLPIGNYQLTLTVSDGIYTDTDTMIFGVPAGAGVVPPPVDVLQEQVQNTKDKISNFSISNFDAPNDKAAENRRKALLNMLDKVSEHIDTGDYQAAIDQLRDILGKTDGLQPPDSEPDWILGVDAQAIFQEVSDLIADLLLVCSECS